MSNSSHKVPACQSPIGTLNAPAIGAARSNRRSRAMTTMSASGQARYPPLAKRCVNRPRDVAAVPSASASSSGRSASAGMRAIGQERRRSANANATADSARNATNAASCISAGIQRSISRHPAASHQAQPHANRSGGAICSDGPTTARSRHSSHALYRTARPSSVAPTKLLLSRGTAGIVPVSAQSMMPRPNATPAPSCNRMPKARSCHRR